MTAALRAQPTPATDERDRELRRTLRRRLLVSAGLFVGFYGLLGVMNIPMVLAPDAPRVAVRFMYAQWIVSAVIAAIGVVVWLGRDLSLRALRAAEFGIFGAGAGFLAAANIFTAQLHGWLALPEGRVTHPFFASSGTRLDPLTLRWFAVITGYGLVIPNTWRRCAIVAGVMAFAYLGTLVVQGNANGMESRAVVAILIYPTVWMLVAWVAAGFGAYRLGLLQQQVYEARKLGQYRLREQIGGGGMGEVWLAEHVLLRQPRAVKMVRSEQAGRPETLARFEREVTATARMKHRNIVEIYDYGRAADGTFYYVMEYLAGLNLEHLVTRHGALPPARAIALLRQVCAALGVAHAIGLVHRDIKPENVIVTAVEGDPDLVKLLDFGLVKDLQIDTLDARLTQGGMVAGTPAFMSPEQIEGLLRLDARSDIYGLGCLAFLLLTGRPPFGDRTVLAAFAAHLHESPVPPSRVQPAVSPALDAVVLRCLAKNRDERFADVASLDAALAACPEAGGWSRAAAAEWWRQHPAAKAAV